jgi:flavin-binding protein dodecin
LSSNKTYKKITVVGTSENSVTDAVENAVDEADESVENLDWFEVDEIRGAIKETGLVYQVSVDIGFRLE